MYEPATEPDEAHRRWLLEVLDHWCCLRGRVFCLRHGQPPTPPQQGAREDWRRTPDRPDKHHAGKQTFLRGADPWTGRRAVGDDNERDYHGEVYWHRCCSTSTPTTRPYTPTLAASSMQTTCAFASQGNDFNNIEASLTSAMSTMTTYYDTNQLRANHSKTSRCAFHLMKREANEN